MLALQGDEQILDLATGTGRVARPVAKRLKNGRIIGVDQALAMLDVGHQHSDPIPAYYQSAGEADALPFKSNSFDRAFVSFSLHHFGNSEGVVKEVLRVLKNGGRFVVLDPVIEEAKDSVDVALEAKINQVFRRTHGERFSFSHGQQHSTFANKSGLPHTADQHFVLLFQSGRHGRYSHRPALAGSGRRAGNRSAGVGGTVEKALLHVAQTRRPCSRQREFFLCPDLRGEAGLDELVSGVGFQVSSFKSLSFPLLQSGMKGDFPDSKPEIGVNPKGGYALKKADFRTFYRDAHAVECLTDREKMLIGLTVAMMRLCDP